MEIWFKLKVIFEHEYNVIKLSSRISTTEISLWAREKLLFPLDIKNHKFIF